MNSCRYDVGYGTIQLIGVKLVCRDSTGKLLRRCNNEESLKLLQLADELEQNPGAWQCYHRVASGLELVCGLSNHNLRFTRQPGDLRLLLPRPVCAALKADLDRLTAKGVIHAQK